MIYMRENSRFIEIRGTSYLYELIGPNFAALAGNFLVNFDAVKCHNLQFHKQPSYVLSREEMLVIVHIAYNHLKQCLH